MMKKLKQEEKKEEQNPERKADNKNEIIISAKSFFASLCLPERRLLKSNVALLQTGKEIKMPRFVFHPPAV